MELCQERRLSCQRANGEPLTKLIGLGQRLARCFTDHRKADRIEHGLADLLRQRIFGLGLGYEDLIDHDALGFDPALTAALDKQGGAVGWRR